MRRRYAVFVIALSVLSLIAVVLVNVAYTGRVNERSERRQAELRAESERKFCEVLRTFTSQTPATTARGREVEEQVLRLQKNLGCEERS